MQLTPRRFCAALILLAGALICGWGAMRFMDARGAVQRYKQELATKGEKLGIDDLLPAPASTETNSAGLFRRALFLTSITTGTTALQTNPPPAMRMVAPGKAMIGTRVAEVRDQATNTWDDFDAEIEDNAEGLGMLESIIAQPHLDFNLDYHQGFTLMLPHLSKLKQGAVLLKSAAVCDLRHTNAPAAIKRIRAILALVKGNEEPLLISQLVRFAMAHLALDATWEVLHTPSVDEAQLAIVQRAWEQLDFFPGAEKAVLMERALIEETAERMRNSSVEYRNVMSLSSFGSAGPGGNWIEQAGREVIGKAHESAWRYGWSYPDQLRALKGQQAVLQALRSVRAGQPFGKALAEEHAALARAGIQQRTNDDNGFFFGSFDPRTVLSQGVVSEERFPERLMAIEAARRLVITAIALERYRKANESYPANLDPLTPAWLETVPLDPVDNQPLRYRPGTNGLFVLYSIGADAVDNGGDPTPPATTKEFPWLKGKDQVWPQPATEEEVEKFLKDRARGKH